MEATQIFRNEIYIGKNGSGKTYFLEEKVLKDIRKKVSDKNVIYIPTEQNFKVEEKDKTANNGTFNNKIKELIKIIFSEITSQIITLDEKFVNEKLPNRTKIKKDYQIFVEDKLSNDDDDFILSFSDLIKDKFTIDTFEIDLSKFDTPSGQNNYSLIKILSELLLLAKEKNIEISENKDMYLIIDEPEKFCHPQLIKKLALYLKYVSNYINVILTSHSPEFISYYLDEKKTTLFIIEKNILKKSFLWEDIYKELDDNKQILGFFKNKIWRVEFIANIIMSNIIMVEGHADKSIVELAIINNEKINEYGIIRYFGKQNYLNTLNVIINIFSKEASSCKVIFDLDDVTKEKHKDWNNDILNSKVPDENILSLDTDLECEFKNDGIPITDNKETNLWVYENYEEIKKTKTFSKIQSHVLK